MSFERYKLYECQHQCLVSTEVKNGEERIKGEKLRDTDQAINVLPHRKTSSYICAIAFPLRTSHSDRIDVYDLPSLDAPWR